MLLRTSPIFLSQLRSGQTRTKAMHGSLVLLPDISKGWGYNLLLRVVSPTGPLMAVLHARTTSHVPAAPRQLIFSTGFPRVIGPRPKRRQGNTLPEQHITTHMLNESQRADAFSAYAPDSVFSPPAVPARCVSRTADLNAPWSAFQGSPLVRLVRAPWTQRPHHGQRQRGLRPSPASRPTPGRRVRMDFKQSADSNEVAPTAMDTG